jgi:unsaturated chondroitin disaccharide hydrolase
MRRRVPAAFMAACALLLAGGCATAPATSQQDVAMSALIDTQLRQAATQYLQLAERTPADKMPRTYKAQTDTSVDSGTDWWTSGFYPGTLWMLYGYTQDARLRAEAERRLAILEKEQHFTGNHDIGFMIFNSFGNALKLTGDARYRRVIDTAAETATTRYKPTFGAIQSWNASKEFRAPVIIDNLMNLELLLWVAGKGGDARYREIALRHADTTLAQHYRPDCSSYHVVDFDPHTGKVLRKRTWQGAADDSAWARGQGWGLYGYTMLYRFTREPRYLQQARCIAGFLLDHPRMPADGVPYWDFDAPGIPDALRDASAGALIASALLELGQYVEADEGARYVGAAKHTLQSLSAPPYRAEPGGNGGFLLKHSVGSLPHKSEVDVPLTYADYYYVEALLRYRDWVLTP